VSLSQPNLSQSILSFVRRPALLLILVPLFSNGTALAGVAERDQARRIHDRLAGIPPTNTVLDAMEAAILANPGTTGEEDAADIAMNNPAFYNVTLKNYAAPWTNEAQTTFVPLNDYTATVIGIIRDDLDFRQVLFGDIIYTGNASGLTAYSNSNNNHYEQLEQLGPVTGDLSNTGILQQQTQSSVTGLPANATAGVITTRAAAEAFFTDGTNRAMLRFTLMNHLCTDLEPLKDVSRIPDRVRQDVSRSPGGDSRIFMFSCIGCHAGMDGLTGAYSKYNFNTVTNSLDYARTDATALADETLNGYVAGGISGKYANNADNFKSGYITTDESWINYWRNGPNKLLGWNATPNDPDLHGNERGEGAKSMGAELANSTAFASCQVKKAFKAVCFRNSDDYAADRTIVDTITTSFMSGYNMKSVFAKVAAYCSK